MTQLNTAVQPLISGRAQRAACQPIGELMAQALANPALISLAAGFVDTQTLPAAATQQALAGIFSDPEVARKGLQYGTTLGDPELRDLLIQRNCAGLNKPPATEQVVLTAGSNQLLHLLAECLLEPGDIVLCAAPTYLVFLGTLSSVGATSVGVTSDEQGMVPAALEEQLAAIRERGDEGRVKAIYLVPYFDNPRGITMPPARIAEIIDIARRWSTKHRIHVIADEAYRELRYDGDEVPTAIALDDEGDTVIAAGTFSKSYSPGIRVGWGILPRPLVEPVASLKGNVDFGSPNFSQLLMRRVIESGLFEEHLHSIRASYASKCGAMLEAAEEFLGPIPGVRWTRPRGGLYVWVELPEEVDTGPDGELLPAAIEEGVLYVPGQYAFAAEGVPQQANTIRMSFGVESRESIRTGVQALANAIRSIG